MTRRPRRRWARSVPVSVYDSSREMESDSNDRARARQSRKFGHETVIRSPLRVDLVRVDEAVGVGQRQRLQQDAVDQREDRRRRADAERERRQDDQRERRRPRVRPDRVSEVVTQIIDKHVRSDA